MQAQYEHLARSMQPEFDRNGSQCREKIKGGRVQKDQGKTGRGRKSMKFYEQLNNILGNRPATRPEILVDSGTSGATDEDAGYSSP